MEEQKKNTKAEQRAARKARLKNEPLHIKIVWWCIYALIGALSIAGVYLVARQHVLISPQSFETPPVLIAATPTLAPEKTIAQEVQTPEITPLPVFVRSEPVSISFLKPELTAEVQTVGLDGRSIGTIDSAVIAAWYEGGAAPGEPGNCIINGHVTWKGKKGIFSYLRDMEVGEELVVKREDGAYVYYEAVERGEYPYDNFPPEMLSVKGEERLTLITCKGDYDNAAGTSLTRVVVIAKQKGIVEAQDIEGQDIEAQAENE